MSELTSTINSGALEGKYLTFAVSRECYGIEILKVQEIIKVPNITVVPKSPEYIKGVINLRGKIIPVVDLRLKFGIEPIKYNERTCVIVINVRQGEQKISIGIIVDTVLEVLSFQSAEIDQPPSYGANLDTSFILGMGKKDERLTILIDIEQVLSSKEQNQLANILENN